jgi:hypothetical protein
VADDSILSDDEYRAYLDALARKYVRLYRLGRHHPEGWAHLHYEIESAISLARLVAVTAEREDDKRLLSALGDGLQHAYLGWLVRSLDDSGVLRAIDEDPATIFGNLRPSVIPAEDRALLHDAGIRDADAEITLTIQYSRRHLATPRPNVSPTEAVRQAPEQVERAGKELSRIADVDETSEKPSATRRKRKILNATGKILTGSIAGAGNLLLGLGSLAAPNPGVGFAVIGSCALAVGSICQGMGDMRDE